MIQAFAALFIRDLISRYSAKRERDVLKIGVGEDRGNEFLAISPIIVKCLGEYSPFPPHSATFYWAIILPFESRFVDFRTCHKT